MNIERTIDHLTQLRQELADARAQEKAATARRREAKRALEAFVTSIRPALRAATGTKGRLSVGTLRCGYRTNVCIVQTDPSAVYAWVEQNAPELLKRDVKWGALRDRVRRGLVVPGVAVTRARMFYVSLKGLS